MKKRLLKIAKYIGFVFLLIVIALIIFIYFTGPSLPEDSEKIIDEVINSKIPELVTGDSGYVNSDGYNIWYESIEPKTTKRGTIILMMGIATDSLFWPKDFIQNFIDSGYQVIRFDYRGVGASDWVEDWKKNPYTIPDIVKDAVLILETLDVSKVHLVGMSFGGMVAQQFAIEHPELTLSMTTIMSSADIKDKEVPSPSNWIKVKFGKVAAKYALIQSEKNLMKLTLAVKVIIRGDATYDINVKETCEQVLYNMRNRKGFNPDVPFQHQDVMYSSPNRIEKLKKLDIPTLIIHGVNDPFVSIEHSKKMAEIIPNAKTKWFDNMGHDLPLYLIDSITTEIINHIEQN